ncbi:MAG: RagB/SusD family nutrient uptake outer membrane protein [Mangrovibacterium sp.]
MKKLSVIPILLAALLMSSCSGFLEEEPMTQLTEEDIYGSDAKIELLLSGLYTQWRNTRQDRGGLIFTLGSDEGKQGSQQVHENNDQAALDKYNNALSSINSTLAAQWNKRWPIVWSAAKVYKYATSPELKAEGAFLRAALNYELAMFWGEIPIIDVDNLKQERQPLTDVFEFIIADLEFASANMPEMQDDKKIPVRNAAKALLGKVYMSAPEETGLRDYAKAIESFDEVIPHYALISNYADLYNASLDQNTSEVIYAFQFVNIYPDNNMVQHHAGSRAVADLDGNTYFGGYDLLLPTEYCFRDRSQGGLWEPGDTRKEASIRYDLTLPDGRVPRITWTGQTDELDPHIRKFEDIRTQGKQNFWYSGGLIYYLRLSDILLSKAECLNEQGQTAAAVGLVNSTVRTRAFGGTLPAQYTWPTGMSQNDFRTQILDERMRELCFEGWRRIDLIRTGTFVDLVKERNVWARTEGTISDYHVRYPIPDSEIKQNEFINEDDQNPGY